MDETGRNQLSSEENRNDIMDVRMFSNWAQMTVGYPPEECGMCGSCKCYFVVEGDGSVYPSDFYAFVDFSLLEASVFFIRFGQKVIKLRS